VLYLDWGSYAVFFSHVPAVAISILERTILFHPQLLKTPYSLLSTICKIREPDHHFYVVPFQSYSFVQDFILHTLIPRYFSRYATFLTSVDLYEIVEQFCVPHFVYCLENQFARPNFWKNVDLLLISTWASDLLVHYFIFSWIEILLALIYYQADD